MTIAFLASMASTSVLAQALPDAAEPVATTSSAALHAPPRRFSPSLAMVSGLGITSGVLGVGALGLAAASAQSPEPYGLVIFGSAGVVLLASGTVIAGASSWAQGRRIGASPVLARSGLVLLGTGLALGTLGTLLPQDGGIVVVGTIGGALLGATGLGLVMAQGVRNVNHARRVQVSLLPRLGRELGVTVAARW